MRSVLSRGEEGRDQRPRARAHPYVWGVSSHRTVTTSEVKTMNCMRCGETHENVGRRFCDACLPRCGCGKPTAAKRATCLDCFQASREALRSAPRSKPCEVCGQTISGPPSTVAARRTCSRVQPKDPGTGDAADLEAVRRLRQAVRRPKDLLERVPGQACGVAVGGRRSLRGGACKA